MRSGSRSPQIVVALLAVSLWMAGSRPASAAPITYDEAINGPLVGQNIGTFDIGANTVAGTDTSFDSFLFTVAAGQQLDSIVLTTLNGGSQGFTLAPPGALDVASRYGFYVLAPSDVGSDFLPALLLSDPGKTATAPLPAGTYEVVLGVIVPVDYKYTFNVSAAAETPTVPEPATLTLTGLGLLGAVFLRRRRTSGGD